MSLKPEKSYAPDRVYKDYFLSVSQKNNLRKKSFIIDTS